MKAPAQRLCENASDKKYPAGAGRRNGAYGDSAGNAREDVYFFT
jgi:hypothetical protein